MKTVTVSEAALDSIKAMAAQLQAERDELLAACRRSVCVLAAVAQSNPLFGEDYEFVSQAIANATKPAETSAVKP